MWTEDLKGWLRETTHKKEMMSRRWDLLVRLLHCTFGYMNPSEELAWATMILILKGKDGVWGIGIVEVAWKVCAAVSNCRLKQVVVLNEALHRFRVGR